MPCASEDGSTTGVKTTHSDVTQTVPTYRGMSEMSTYLYLKMSVFYAFDPKTVDLINVKVERNVSFQLETLLNEEMRNDLSPEDSSFLKISVLTWTGMESWSGEWEVSVSPFVMHTSQWIMHQRGD